MGSGLLELLMQSMDMMGTLHGQCGPLVFCEGAYGTAIAE